MQKRAESRLAGAQHSGLTIRRKRTVATHFEQDGSVLGKLRDRGTDRSRQYNGRLQLMAAHGLHTH